MHWIIRTMPEKIWDFDILAIHNNNSNLSYYFTSKFQYQYTDEEAWTLLFSVDGWGYLQIYKRGSLIKIFNIWKSAFVKIKLKEKLLVEATLHKLIYLSRWGVWWLVQPFHVTDYKQSAHYYGICLIKDCWSKNRST